MTKRNGVAVAVVTILFWLVLALLVLSFLGCTSSAKAERECHCSAQNDVCKAECSSEREGETSAGKGVTE